MMDLRYNESCTYGGDETVSGAWMVVKSLTIISIPSILPKSTSIKLIGADFELFLDDVGGGGLLKYASIH